MTIYITDVLCGGGVCIVRGILGAYQACKYILMSTRKVMDCRKFPSESNCSLTIAGTEDEVLSVAVQHAIDVHGHAASPELREEIRATLTDEA